MPVGLDRFLLPDPEPDPVTECEICGSEIYPGETAYEYDGEYYCSRRCLVEFLLQQDVVHRVEFEEVGRL